MFGAENQLAGVAGQGGCLGEDRHALVEGNHGEVHQNADAGDPHPGLLPVEPHDDEERQVGEQNE